MPKTKYAKIDARVTWITLTEAIRVWHIASRSTVLWQYWKGKLLARKSAGVWMVFVPDMRKRFGEPRENIVIVD